jgi:hypothetical protein
MHVSKMHQEITLVSDISVGVVATSEDIAMLIFMRLPFFLIRESRIACWAVNEGTLICLKIAVYVFSASISPTEGFLDKSPTSKRGHRYQHVRL